MTNIGEQQAFPVCTGVVADTLLGMTYRQWLVGMALQGLLVARQRKPCAVRGEPRPFKLGSKL